MRYPEIQVPGEWRRRFGTSISSAAPDRISLPLETAQVYREASVEEGRMVLNGTDMVLLHQAITRESAAYNRARCHSGNINSSITTRSLRSLGRVVWVRCIAHATRD